MKQKTLQPDNNNSPVLQVEDVKYKITIKYGYCNLRSWSEFIDGKLVGMGSKTCYDQYGNITEHSVTETGAILWLS